MTRIFSLDTARIFVVSDLYAVDSTMYSEENMELTFLASGLPSIIARMGDTQRVIPLDDSRSIVTFDVEMEASGIFKVLGPILKGRFASTFGLVQEDLKIYVETGQASE